MATQCVHELSHCAYCTPPLPPDAVLARAAVQRMFAPTTPQVAQRPVDVVPVPSTDAFTSRIYDRPFNPLAQQLPRLHQPHWEVTSPAEHSTYFGWEVYAKNVRGTWQAAAPDSPTIAATTLRDLRTQVKATR